MGVLVGPDLSVDVQLEWALRLAWARDLDLVVYQQVEGAEDRTSEVPVDAPTEGTPDEIGSHLMRLAEGDSTIRLGQRCDPKEGEEAEDTGRVTHVLVHRLHHSSSTSLRKQLLAEIGKAKLKLVTVPRSDIATNDPETEKETQLFLRYAPCEVVFCFGLTDGVEFSRVMVAVASGPHASAAIRLGSDIARVGDGSLTAVRVNPSIGPDAEDVGELRLDSRLRKSLGRDSEGVRHRIVVDDQIHTGIRRVWEEGRHDLLVMGASRAGLQGSRVRSGVPIRVFKGEPRPVLAVVSAGSPIKNRAVGFVEGSIERLVPQIDRENRVALVDRIQSSSRWDFDFFTLMALSTTIAAVGLIQNSAAVVIGAMLVAPLMTPLLGLGLSLVQGNPVLARISTRAILLGLFVALMVGVIVGLLTPGFVEPTREMLGRGRPGALDLIVAFASGLAAAYASARPGLLAALPGVAIAAALVPPIATAGLALSLGNLDLAFNAFLLFVINTVVIVLASTISLWAVGLRNIKRVSRWRMILGSAVLVSALVLGVSMSLKSRAHPITEGLPRDLETLIAERLGDDFELDGLAVAYDEIGVQLNVRVVGSTVASESLADEIRSLVRGRFNKPVRVRLLTTVGAGFED
jgi:uncharacterized hydrophobic protein (TIGR00271 family)